MDPNKLRHLLALEQHGTFQRAADAVHLSQPALSRSMHALEQEVGVPLLERRGRGSALTEAGQHLARRARRLLLDQAEALREIELLTAGELGRLRIGVSGPLMTVGLRTFAHQLTRTLPRVRVEITFGDTTQLVEQIHAERLDVIAGGADQLAGDPLLDVEVLPPIWSGLYCRPGHPVLQAQPLDFAAVKRYQVASLPAAADMRAEIIERVGPAADPVELVTFLCPSPELLLELARDTDTILGVGSVVARDDLAAGRLVQIPLGVGKVAMRLALARLRGRALTPTLRLFCDCIRGAVTPPADHE